MTNYRRTNYRVRKLTVAVVALLTLGGTAVVATPAQAAPAGHNGVSVRGSHNAVTVNRVNGI